MLENAISAMNSVEQAMSQSHQLVISLFREFLDHDVSLPENVLEEDTLEDISEPEDVPLVDPETGEPRFKLLRRAFKGNKKLEAQLDYLAKKISHRGEVKILDAKAIMGINDTKYVRRLLDRLIKRGLLRAEGKTSSKRYIWAGPPAATPKSRVSLRAPHHPGLLQAGTELVERQPPQPSKPVLEKPTKTGRFSVLRRALKGNEALEAQLKHLLDAVMRKGEVKIKDAKSIMDIDNTVYVRSLLDRLTKRGFLRTSGKTKAKKYIWTGQRPDWLPEPRKSRVDPSCPRCGRNMKPKGAYLRCPTRGCPGKRDIGSAEVGKLPPKRSSMSQEDVLAIILSRTSNNPAATLFIDTIAKEFNVPTASLTSLLSKQPELEIKRNEITRKTDEAFKCPFARSSSRPYIRIAYATRTDGTQPARRAWEKLNPKARNHFTKLFERICQHGRIDDGSKFKRLEGDIWEFKSNTHKRRITCFMHDKVIYLAHIFKKKEDKTPRQELAMAEAIMAEHLARSHSKRYLRRHRRRRRNPWRDGAWSHRREKGTCLGCGGQVAGHDKYCSFCEIRNEPEKPFPADEAFEPRKRSGMRLSYPQCAKCNKFLQRGDPEPFCSECGARPEIW
jgi:phage-related protein